jgi:hypothetical protein
MCGKPQSSQPALKSIKPVLEMEQPADRDIFTKFVEAIDRGLGLQDFHLDAVLGQKLQGFGTDLQSPPDPF